MIEELKHIATYVERRLTNARDSIAESPMEEDWDKTQTITAAAKRLEEARHQIDTQLPAGSLYGAARGALWRAVRRVSREALRIIGTDWSDPPDSWLMNHRWRDRRDLPASEMPRPAGARGPARAHHLPVSRCQR